MSSLNKLEKYIIEWSIEHAEMCTNSKQLNHLQELLKRIELESGFRNIKKNTFSKYKE